LIPVFKIFKYYGNLPYYIYNCLAIAYKKKDKYSGINLKRVADKRSLQGVKDSSVKRKCIKSSKR